MEEDDSRVETARGNTRSGSGPRPLSGRNAISPGKRYLLIFIGLMLIAAAGIGGFYYWRSYNTGVVQNPFKANILNSVEFPLYYPARLPDKYTIDPSSVTMPQGGVVVFQIKGSKGQIIYVSEEARPATFDFGGYYNNFSDKKLALTDLGTVAVGYINQGRTGVGSLATNKTWILLNTVAPVNLSVLQTMLSHLAVSH